MGVPPGRHAWWIVDRTLVEAARNGDRQASSELLRSRVGRLFAIAQRILRDVHRAEDAVQEALVTAWRDLPGLRDSDRFDAWLHRLVVNACLAEARRARRLVASIVELPVDIAVGGDEYLRIAERDELERAFRRRPPDQRALLVLRHGDGRRVRSRPGHVQRRAPVLARGGDRRSERGTWHQASRCLGDRRLVRPTGIHRAGEPSVLDRRLPAGTYTIVDPAHPEIRATLTIGG